MTFKGMRGRADSHAHPSPFLLQGMAKVLFRVMMKGLADRFGAERRLVAANHELFPDALPLPVDGKADRVALKARAEKA